MISPPDVSALAAHLGIRDPVRIVMLHAMQYDFEPDGGVTVAFTRATPPGRPHVIEVSRRALALRLAHPERFYVNACVTCPFDLRSLLVHETFHALQQERCCADQDVSGAYYDAHGPAMECAAERAGCDPALRALVVIPGEVNP